MVDFSTWKKAWALLDAGERQRAWVVLGVVLVNAAFAAVSVGSIMPFLAVLSDPTRIQTVGALAWAYEAFGFASDYSFLVALGLASFAMIVLASLTQIANTWSIARFSTMLVHSISCRLLGSYLSQPYEFFLNRHTGEMGPKVLSESAEVVQRFFGPAAMLIAAGMTTVAIVGLLVAVNPIIALGAFAILGGAYAVIYLLVRSLLKQLGRIRVEANRLRFRMANEALSGIKDIKLLGREPSYLRRFEVPSMRMTDANVKTSILSGIPQIGLQAVALGGVIFLCILLIDPADLSAGAALGGILPVLGVFALAGQRLMPQLAIFYQSVAQIQTAAAAVDAVHEDLELGRRGGSFPRHVTQALGLMKSLELEAVSYSYPNADQAGVRDVSLLIRAGEKIGIVGSTGAGKTTLADIILGLLLPRSGRLIADGINITHENIRTWMQSVGYVPQDIFLTDAPVAENIALGVPPEEINMERIRKAASVAQIDRFVEEELPEGYQTHVGERGVRLSGGQRQRIGIARAMYHDADLIVFDEATSALDNLTEAEVMEAIDALPGDKTVIMIAHRLSTVKGCDRIVVLDKGRVVGCDSWAILMSKNSVFQRIAKIGEAA
jgi:ABC-type multidrug transport system fused ATPase/permease subunit